MQTWNLSDAQTAKARTGTSRDRRRSKEQDRLTTEEQKNVIGGVVLEYSEVKQKIAALRQEIANKRLQMQEVEQALRLYEYKKLPDQLKGWPTAEFITTTLATIEGLEARKTALEQTMRQYGLDLK
jgi:anti-sigma28 factor (negative regulator of flagellin synthesis)